LPVSVTQQTLPASPGGLFSQRLQDLARQPVAPAFSLQLILLYGWFFFGGAIGMLTGAVNTSTAGGPGRCRANRSERALPGGGCNSKPATNLNLQTHRCRPGLAWLYGLPDGRFSNHALSQH